MLCPRCQSDRLRVVATGRDFTALCILRRRQCSDCSHQFASLEIAMPLPDSHGLPGNARKLRIPESLVLAAAAAVRKVINP